MVKLWEYLTGKIDGESALLLILTLLITMWLKLPQLLFSRLKEVFDFQILKFQLKSNEADDLKLKLAESNKAVVELTREIDVRKEINRQDQLEISELRRKLDNCESVVSDLKRSIRDLEDRLDEARAKIKNLGSE